MAVRAQQFGIGPTTCFVVAAALSCGLVASAEGAPLVRDDFQGGAPGDNPAGPSYVIEPAGTGARVVDGATTPVDPFGGAGNQSLMLFDDLNATGASTQVGYQFANQAGAGRLTIDFVLEKNATWDEPYTGVRFNDNDGDNITTVPEIGPWILINGANNPTQATSARIEALENNGSGGTAFVATTLAISYNTPHTLVLDFDLATQTYTMSVDGTPLATGGAAPRSTFNFRAPLSEINNLEMYTAASTRVDSRVFYDNVTVVPEPASLALVGLGGLAATARRRGRAGR